MKTLRVNKISDSATIGIFSPSEPIVEERRNRFMSGVSMLEGYGFTVKFSDNCFNAESFMAGTIEERTDDIHQLIRDDEVDLLLASWGGKGCNQLVRYLDYDLISRSRKAILGFSDPCVISNNITAKTGLVTFYGPNVVGKLDETSHSDLKILKNGAVGINLLGTDVDECKPIIEGKASGKLIGGNLSTFVLGVLCTDIDLIYYKGAILFWEDLGNPPQIITQYLTALDNAGVLSVLSGMVIGQFKSKDKKAWKDMDCYESISRIVGKYNYPVLYHKSFGHSHLENPIFPIGALCEIDTTKPALTLKEDIIV